MISSRDSTSNKSIDNPFFSYRYIAKKLSIDASHVVKIFQKQRHISGKLIEDVSTCATLRGKRQNISHRSSILTKRKLTGNASNTMSASSH